MRSIYQGYLGWFDGNAAHIHPMSPGKKIQRWKRLLGENGYTVMLNDVERSIEKSSENYQNEGKHLKDELQWCLEVTSMILKAPDADDAIIQIASILSAQCMREMASETHNAPTRNYFLTSAKELDSSLVFRRSQNYKAASFLQKRGSLQSSDNPHRRWVWAWKLGW